MLCIRRLASYRPKGQGEAGYEAAKGDVNHPDRHLFNRYSDGTGNEERPLRGTNPNRPDGGRCLHSLRTWGVRGPAGITPISANLRVEPSEECDASVPR